MNRSNWQLNGYRSMYDSIMYGNSDNTNILWFVFWIIYLFIYYRLIFGGDK